MMQQHKGFSLIELMIVVAIISILAVMAIPAYQNFAVRAKIAEGLGLADAAKTAVTETYVTVGSWPADNEAAGLDPTIAGEYVVNVTVSGAVITVTYTNDENIAGKTLELNGSSSGGSFLWDCAGGSLDDKYRPPRCR